MQNENIMVSIICTTFNHEQYIGSCIDGFLIQKADFDYEIIIHDDCSTDSTAEIIRKYVEKEPKKFKFILQTENQYSKGVDIIGDIMIPHARGKYIAFCEGDDAWIDETKLARQVAFMENHPEYIACVHNTFFHRCDKYCKDFPMFVHDRDRDLGFQDILRWNAFGFHYSSLLVKKEYFIKPPFGYGEYFMALFLALSGKIRFIDRNMSVYRFRSGKYATRTYVFTKEATIREVENIVKGLRCVRNYAKDDYKKSLIDIKISTFSAWLTSLRSITDQEYDKELKKQEWLFDIKLFIRSHFRIVYKMIISRR